MLETNSSEGFYRAAQEGVTNAVRSLSMLGSQNFSMDLLWAGNVPTTEISGIPKTAEDIVIGAYVQVKGDAPGHALLVFPRGSAAKLADIMMGQEAGTTIELGEMESSVIQEVANILTSSYLTAISDYNHFTLLPEPPLMAEDMAAAVMENFLLTTGRFDMETTSIVTRFKSGEEEIDGFFLYIPEV